MPFLLFVSCLPVSFAQSMKWYYAYTYHLSTKAVSIQPKILLVFTSVGMTRGQGIIRVVVPFFGRFLK